RYFRTLSQALRGKLGNGTGPLVLAAVAEHFPLLRRAELPATVLERAIEGNPDHASDLELHRQAWPIVEEWAQSGAPADVERFGTLAAHGKAAHVAADVLAAAAAGRIDTLLTATEAEMWGRFDAASVAVTIHTARERGDEELINFAVCQTLAARGAVRELPGDLMPHGAPMAALFRY
ncbi:MAG TPA: hypothetical protein VFE44_00250, partial [Thermoanaerobaculia bacterium]|nr:hypothetical protein [Thermoanaerobaculia bacterium]